MRKLLYLAVICIALLSCTEDKMPSGMAFGTPTSSGYVETPSITADMTSLSFSADGDSKTITITANFAWETISSPDWITVSPTNGTSGATTLTIKAVEYTESSSRTGTIKLGKPSIATVSISVFQQSSSQGNTYVAQVDAGGNQVMCHSLLLLSDGSLWATGSNNAGQLGDGTTNDKYNPVKILDNVIQIAAGCDYSIALKNDNSLWAWGVNSYGQFGLTVTPDWSNKPIKVMEDVDRIAAGWFHTLAIKKDGTLWTWGGNQYGQLGNGTETDDNVANPNPTYIMDEVAQIAAGWMHSLALKKDGTLWAWGGNTEGQIGDETLEKRLYPVKIMDNVKSVFAGHRSSFAIKNDGTLWGWGYGSNGNLGNESYAYSNPSPTLITDKVAQVAVGGGHTLVLKNDGTLWVCGSNYFGQLGLGLPTGDESAHGYFELTRLMSNVICVGAGDNCSIIVKNDGVVWACGKNSNGEFGNGSTSEAVALPIQCFSVSSLK